jgi:bifunctional non-homologous end joining protein LigD
MSGPSQVYFDGISPPCWKLLDVKVKAMSASWASASATWRASRTSHSPYLHVVVETAPRPEGRARTATSVRFSRTPEPPGRTRSGRPGFRYVVQKHAASRLHDDFRLELDGVLKSCAVAKGPSLDPAEKRLAVQTEDHPLDYADFEGVIPEGQYGAGTVLVWDRGTWEPIEAPHAGLAKGHLKFRLHGEKLRGGWTLVRIKSRDPRQEGKTWLLIKERDEAARPAAKYDITAARPGSVLTRRDLEQIAVEREAGWS